MAQWWEDYLQTNTTIATPEQPQVWDDADSSNLLRLKGADAPEVFHDITPTGDTKNERSKVYKQLMALNGISEADAIAQVDAEAEAAKIDPNLGLRLKTLRAAGKYTGPYTSHEIYQMGKEATAATTEAEAGKFDDRQNILQARTSFADNQLEPEQIAATPVDSLQKGYFGRGLLDIDTTNEMIAKGYMVPGADPSTAVGKKDYEMQMKLADKAKRLGLGLWKDPNQARMMKAISDTSYSQQKYLDELRKEGKSNLTGIETVDETIDTLQSGFTKVGASAIGLLGKGLKAAGEYNQELANKYGDNYVLWDTSKDIGQKLDDWSQGVNEYADAYFGATGSEGQMVDNVWKELKAGNFGDAVDEVTLKDSIKLVAGMAPYVVGMMTGAGQAGLWASIANDGIEEAKKESPNGDISDARTYAILGASALSLGLEKLGIDALFKGKTALEISKLIPKSVQTELVKKVTKSGGLIATETLTEPMQELLLILSTQVGQKDGTLSEELERVLTDEKNLDRLGASAVGGTIAGGTVRAPVDLPGIALETAKTTGQTIGSQVGKAVNNRAEAKAQMKSEEARASRVDSMKAKDDNYANYTEAQTVETPDAEMVNIGGEEVKVFEEPVNLKVKANSAEEYSDLLETQKDQVVQSLYELNPKTGKIVGLSETAKKLEAEGKLEERVNKVNAWLEKYKNEYAIKEQLREADQKVVDSVTEDMILNNKLTEEQKVELSLSAANKVLTKEALTDQELQFFNSYTNDVNRIIQDEKAKLKSIVPDNIAKTVDYLTGPDAQVHLESMLAKKAEQEDVQSMEQEVADKKSKVEVAQEELKDITDETAKIKKQQEIDNLNQEIIDAEAMIDTVKAEMEKPKVNADTIVETDKDRVELDTLTEEEIKTVYQNEIEAKVSKIDDTGKVTYLEGWNADKVTEVVKETAKKTFEARRKYRFGEEVGVEADYDKLSINVNKKKAKKGLVVDTTKVNGNRLVESIIAGNPEEAIPEYNKDSSKLLHRVLGRISAAVTGSDYKIARDAMRKIQSVAKSDKLKDIFNQDGINEGEGAILLAVTLGTINSAVVTDTLARQRVTTSDVSGQIANMAQNEYWASETNILTQIGKDFLTSRGLKLAKGTPTQQAEQYRKIGVIGLELAIDAGLAERSNEKISSVVSKEAVDKDGKRLKPGKANVSLVKDAVDIMNEDTEIMLNSSDYGIRIVGDNIAIDPNGYVQEYDNKEGDVLGRINKLLVSSNLELPNNEPSDDVVVAPTVEPFSNEVIDIKDTVIKLQNTAYSIKPEMMKILEKIKSEVDETYNGNLDKYLSNKGQWAAEMLGINQYATKSQILAFNDAGVSNGIKDSLRGIIDNLDVLKGDLYFTYQIDKNNRITIRETVLNFQADKVIARQILTSANQNTYKMEEAAFDTQVEMLNELGFKADKEGDAKVQYEKAIDIIQNGDYAKRPKSGLTKGEQIAWEVVGVLSSNTYKNAPWEIANRINNPKSVLNKNNGKKTVKAMEIIDGFREIRKSKGTSTNYQVETDAKASGVMNVLMNIIGFDVNAKEGELTVQKLLEQLGVKLSDSEAANISDKDAYNLLQDKVVEVLGLDKELDDDIANEKYADIRAMISELTELGIDTRELAKPPVMTWFYTAGTETIVGELANTLLEDVFRQAIDGDKKALNHIAKILGRESVTKLDLQKMRVGGKEHKKLMKAYREIGELYEAQLENAFPGVVKFKDTMKDLFETIEATGYGNGIVDSAGQAIYGGGTPGKFNIHKEKQYQLELDTENTRGKKQLGTDLENRQLVTANRLFANFTSLIPLLAQGVDFSILEKTMRELYAKYENDPEFAPMTVHDAIYTAYKYMMKSGKESYNRTIVDVARNYDFVDTIITYGEDTLKRMEEAAKSMTKADLVSHKADMKRLAENIKKWREENGKRIEYKKGKLVKDGKQIEVSLIGGIDLKQETEEGKTTTVEKIAEPKVQSPREKLIETAKGLDNPFTEVIAKDVMKLINDYQLAEYGKIAEATIEEIGMVLEAKDNTPKEVLKAVISAKDLTVLSNPKEGAKTIVRNRLFTQFREEIGKDAGKAVNGLIAGLVGLDDTNAKTMQEIMANRTIEWKWDENAKFQVEIDGSKATITLGKGANTLEQELLERIGHELEHANSAALIEQLAEGKGSKEDIAAYDTIVKVLSKIDIEKVPEGRLKRVLSETKEVDRVAETVAVIRGEQTGAEQFIAEMRKSGLVKTLINAGIDAAKRLIAKVRSGKLEVTKNMEIEQLVQAVEQIHRSAKKVEIESDVQTTREFGAEVESKQQNDRITANEIIEQALRCAKG